MAQSHSSAPSRGINGFALSYSVEENSECVREMHAESNENLHADAPRKPETGNNYCLALGLLVVDKSYHSV